MGSMVVATISAFRFGSMARDAIEERKEDFAWENDLAAFRIYSRFAGDGTASGVDFWAKSVDYPIVNEWYANNATGPNACDSLK